MFDRHEIPGEFGFFPENDSAQFDFTNELQAALRNAPIHNLTEMGNSLEEVEMRKYMADKWRELDDHSLIVIRDKQVLPNEVATSNPSAYSTLIRQAYEIVAEENNGKLATISTSWLEENIQKVVAHETGHAEAVKAVSPFSRVSYRVNIVRLPSKDGKVPAHIGPSVALMRAVIRKVDLGFIIAAPSDLSESDLAQINALGYQSREEILERRAKLPERRLLLGALNLIDRAMIIN